ncbi:hypothetical protein NKZ04_21420 [Sinorhizobium meliloti]|uniref:hypothetical protein n=1 Tax=Rhizobium meliloti TaxID=382 RepID=UPI003D648841
MTFSNDELKAIMDANFRDPEIKEGMLQETDMFGDSPDVEWSCDLAGLVVRFGGTEPVYSGKVADLVVSISGDTGSVSMLLAEPEKIADSTKSDLDKGKVVSGALIVRDMDEGYPDTLVLRNVIFSAKAASAADGLLLTGDIRPVEGETARRSFGFGMSYILEEEE